MKLPLACSRAALLTSEWYSLLLSGTPYFWAVFLTSADKHYSWASLSLGCYLVHRHFISPTQEKRKQNTSGHLYLFYVISIGTHGMELPSPFLTFCLHRTIRCWMFIPMTFTKFLNHTQYSSSPLIRPPLLQW
jgi:hypothetical protein